MHHNLHWQLADFSLGLRVKPVRSINALICFRRNWDSLIFQSRSERVLRPRFGMICTQIQRGASRNNSPHMRLFGGSTGIEQHDNANIDRMAIQTMIGHHCSSPRRSFARFGHAGSECAPLTMTGTKGLAILLGFQRCRSAPPQIIHLSGKTAMIRAGAPDPPPIFIGNAMTVEPEAGNSLMSATFSRAGIPCL